MSYAALGSSGAPQGPWGKIVTRDGWEYQITPEDVLWAARAARCEGGGEEGEVATLWTWTARFALPTFRRRYATLASLIQAHSQPVNPIWRRTGSKCEPGGQFHGSRYCTPEKLSRREECAIRTWPTISPLLRQKVEKWARAELPNPLPTAVDFASSTESVQRGDIEVARFRSPRGTTYNVFYSEPQSRQLGPDFVSIKLDGRTASASPIGKLRVYAPYIGAGAALIAAGFAGWAYWSSRKVP
jgi:hypothetical protein